LTRESRRGLATKLPRISIMTNKVAIILSGCGVYDGSEVHEASACCVALSRAGKQVVFYSLDNDQHHVIDHTSGQSQEESTRNARIEAGRIARGPVLALSDLNIEEVEAVVFPGGFGAAKNLSSFAHSAEPSVDGEVARVIRECLEAAKPMALCCIAPILLALVLCKEDGKSIKLTLGQRTGEGWPYAATIDKAKEFGADVVEMNVDEVCVDEANKIVTTPAYMFDGSYFEIHDGVVKMIEAVLALL